MAASGPARESMKRDLAKLVKEKAYIKLDKPIRLASGAVTQLYFDGKQVTLFPERVVLFCRVLLDALDLSQFDAVGGMSIGADPIVSALSVVAHLDKGLNVPAFLVRKEPKKHGLQKMMEGVKLKKGMRVLVVDDVITQGTATLNAIAAVGATGAKVTQVACLVDREEGGSAKIASAGYKFYSVFKKSDLA